MTFTTPEASDEVLGDLLLDVLPSDCSTLGNMTAREALSRTAARQISEVENKAVWDRALQIGTIKKGRGRSGSIALAVGIEVAVDADRFQRSSYNDKIIN